MLRKVGKRVAHQKFENCVVPRYFFELTRTLLLPRNYYHPTFILQNFTSSKEKIVHTHSLDTAKIEKHPDRAEALGNWFLHIPWKCCWVKTNFMELRKVKNTFIVKFFL
jgi:hypothetical protein